VTSVVSELLGEAKKVGLSNRRLSESEIEATVSSDSATDGEGCDLQDLVNSIHDSVTNLFKLSIALRRATPHDRYFKKHGSELCNFNPHFDIDYIWHKLGQGNPPIPSWLIERLGRANTQRREYFKYRELHRTKLGYVPEVTEIVVQKENQKDSMVPVGTLNTEEEGASLHSGHESVDKSVTVLASTTASSYHETKDLGTTPDEFETMSLVSYATSLGSEESYELRIPPMPKGSDGGSPFECPYCYTIQTIKGKREWRYFSFRNIPP